MAKYKVGDRVRIVSKRHDDKAFVDMMEEYLGKVLTVNRVMEPMMGEPVYRFKEAACDSLLGRLEWMFRESWISGLASGREAAVNHVTVDSGATISALKKAIDRVMDELDMHDPMVRVHFYGRKTVAELVKGGKVVKTAEAKCNPKDTYSRSEGVKIAVDRLFEKKKPVANDDEIKKAVAAGVTEAHENLRKAKRGDKYVVIGGGDYHCFGIGEVVTLLKCKGKSSFFKDCHGRVQFVDNEDVRPYKEPTK